MREIKFRGKAIVSIEELELMGIEHDSGWVYGNLIKNGNRPIISADILEEIDESIYPEWWVVVEPKSVGQYTGLKDKNGKEIYEGDIVIAWSVGVKSICEVKWGRGRVGFFLYRKPTIAWNLSGGGKDYNVENVEVIGNIYENPELLEGDEE